MIISDYVCIILGVLNLYGASETDDHSAKCLGVIVGVLCITVPFLIQVFNS